MNKIFTGLLTNLRRDTLKARCFRSSIVLAAAALFAKFLGFGSKVVLARLLASEEMGLMVIIISLTALFEVLTEIGIEQSVIQHKNGADPEYINMAWWFQSLRAIGLYMIAFIATPWLCEFYFRNKPELLSHYSIEELVNLIRVAFLSILFNGFVSPKAHVLEKNFMFGKAAIISQSGIVLGAIITVILAFIIRNVWAIVIGFAANGFAKCLLSYIICPFIPKVKYHRESFQGLYQFASGMLGLPVLTYIAFNIDVLVAGKLISTSLVGFYGMALMLALTPSVLFSSIISPVLLPAFAEKQDDKKALCKAVIQITQYTSLLIIPPAMLAIACSRTILNLLYGVQYSVVAIPFSILCIYVVFLIQATILACLFFGVGQPGKHRLFAAFRVLILILFIYPAIKYYGLNGAASVVLLASLAAMCLQIAIIHKMIGLNILNYLVSWLPGLILAIPIGVIIVAMYKITPKYANIYLALGTVLCIAVSLTGLFLLRHINELGKCLSLRMLSGIFSK